MIYIDDFHCALLISVCLSSIDSSLSFAEFHCLFADVWWMSLPLSMPDAFGLPSNPARGSLSMFEYVEGKTITPY